MNVTTAMFELDEVKFHLPIKVVPKQSYRSLRMRGGYRDPKVTANMDLIRRLLMARRPAGWAMLTGPLGLTVRFESKWRMSDRQEVRDQGYVWKDTRPDGDNLVKGLQDALETVIYADDAKVCKWDVSVAWSWFDRVLCRVYRLCDSPGRCIIEAGDRCDDDR